MDVKDLYCWGHECWKCNNVQQTDEKVKDGILYWILSNFFWLFNKNE
jgi:hypothetical protein